MPKTAAMQYTLYDPTKPLSSTYKRRAAKELGENTDQIVAHLESFRRWLTSVPHLKCTADDAFLLAFLRHSKYNHMKAQRRLDKFCTFRTSCTEGCPPWFEETAANGAIWNKFVDMKCYVPVGFTHEGTLVIVMKLVNLNPDVVSIEEMQGALQVWNDVCLVDPRAQIGGICFIADLTNLRREDMLKMFDTKSLRISTKYFQECLPFRIKKMIYYNAPKVFESFFKLYSEWLNEKIKSRVVVLGADLNSAFDEFPGLKELMPESFGGDNKLSIEDICEATASTMKALPDVSATWAIAVDESRRPKECRNDFGVYKDLSSEVMGKSGIFVKLNQGEI
ncbi:Clavesin-2 [Taenia crassiceps]|uniref:Clavesin-2 n=1 Tax=Taenia crassiceps TaxID=6207 RepID=A0ABR4QP68_9CEST